MKKLPTLIILSLFAINFTFGQDREAYSGLIKEAMDLYDSEDYLESGQKYSEAFVALGGKGVISDRYNAACSWALGGQADSAFVQLFKIAENGNYTNLGHITTDSDLNSIHEDDRWPQVIDIVRSYKEIAEADLDKPLVAILDTIYREDQKYRRQVNEIKDEYGWESEEMKAHWKLIGEKDSINLIEVQKILDKRGWLGADVIGNQGNTTLFLVIQHSDLAVQEKYLPMMRDAVSKGNASASSLALLEDRVALRNGKRQIYGSQIGRNPETEEYYVSPLEDPDNVDKRRAEMGLGTLQDYVSNYDIVWDVEKYKKELPKLEKMRDK